MRLRLLFLLALGFGVSKTNAQYVNIPDTVFRGYLMAKFPSCFNGAKQLDTTCTSVLQTKSLHKSYLTTINLEGIQYFKSLDTLEWTDCGVETIPSFPKKIKVMYLFSNRLTSLPSLPDSLTFLEIQGNYTLQSLPVLPQTLTDLYCGSNLLTSLPALPASLKFLEFQENRVAILPLLPAGLQSLNCTDNRLTSVPPLPGTLTNAGFYGNLLSALPSLPASLLTLDIGGNPISSLPALPAGLKSLSCNYTNIINLPTLPSGLSFLQCGNNPSFTSLPAHLPPGLQTLQCENAGLTSLPTLPSSLLSLDIPGNSIYCLPKLPTGITSLYFDFDKITCIPNSVSVQTGYPICNATNNTNACLAFPVVKGYEFYDLNSNNVKDPGEFWKAFGRINLSNGAFSFTNDSGYYEMASDTIGPVGVTPLAPAFFNSMPANAFFNFSTYDTSVTRSFALQPYAIRDSVTGLLTSTRVPRPGFDLNYTIDYANNGSTNLSTTKIVLHYNSAILTFNSATNPSIIAAGDSLTLTLPSLRIAESGSFDVNFTTSPASPIGTMITSILAMRSGNAAYTDTSKVVVSGSFDPNDKKGTLSMTPEQVQAGNFIDYTIRYQNTGNDTAFHVVIADTLNVSLKPNTFEMLASSHKVTATVKDKIVFFEMRNIMLPDSNVNEPKSHGFVRFRIKPKTNVNVGADIPNKAAIYFDYNAPVITNTAITQIRNSVMPLRLLSFKGYRTGEADQLNWTTANEVNTKLFEVERSTDGKTFSRAGFVYAHGRGSGEYNYTTEKRAASSNFYRLKMVDLDGAFTYSNVVLIKGDTKGAFFLATNPVKDKLVLTVLSPSLVNTEARLINSAGMVVKSFVIRGTGNQTVNVESLPAGVYYLQTVEGSAKVVK